MILVLSIGASAFAFGSVELWAREWLRLVGLAALSATLWSVSPSRIFGGVPGRLALPVALLVVWGFVQTLPLPTWMVASISPSTASILEQTVPRVGNGDLTTWLLHDSNTGNAQPTPPVDELDSWAEDDHGPVSSLSIYPYASRQSALSWITVLAFFFASVWVARSDLSRYRLLWGVALWTGILGLVAVIQRIYWNEKLLWFRERPQGADPIGPFVSPTHFAGFMELGTLVSLGLGLALLSRSTGTLGWRGIRNVLVDKRGALPSVIVVGVACVLGVCGLLLSGSEGGLISFSAGIVFLAISRRLRWALPVASIAIILVGVGVGFAIALGPGLSDGEAVPVLYGEAGPSFALRLDAWARTVTVILDHPVAGTGMGTFYWAFGRVQRAGEWLSWAHSHNDYLQLLSETGVVGAFFLVWLLVVFVGRVLRRTLSPQAPPRWTTAAAASAVFAMLVHSIVDFNLQIPSNAVLFSVLVGVVVAASDDGTRSQE